MIFKTGGFRFAPVSALRASVLGLVAAAALGAGVSARADLFGDDQARQAILDLRKRVDQVVLSQNRLIDDNAQLRRSLVDLQQQIDSLKADLARERGQNEQLAQQVSDLQKQQANPSQSGAPQNGASAALGGDADSPPQDDGPGANPAMAVSPPANPPREQRDYDAALTQFRGGNFTAAQTGFASFIKRNPRSALAPAALFWLGNAQYATRNYKEAISNFRSLVTVAPQHEKAPEALLSIANCQVELKDQKAARATLQQLVKSYPQSEAATAARDRLAKMR
ncbi:MAG: tol-pal system protein YbgF [Burkholderiaceae bacterium]|nr:tol-pal system protein YbgF [Burkholderiaceae bacterium]